MFRSGIPKLPKRWVSTPGRLLPNQEKVNMDNNKIWRRNRSAHLDSSDMSVVFGAFIEDAGPHQDVICVKVTVTLRSTVYELAESVKAMFAKKFGAARLVTDDPTSIYVQADKAMAFVSMDSRSSYYDEYGAVGDDEPYGENALAKVGRAIGTFQINLLGPPAEINEFRLALESSYEEQRFARIRWWYKNKNGSIVNRAIYMEMPNTKLLPEFYPGLDEDPNAFIKRYLNSDESVLMLSGPPGTGKTTMLRHMITDHRLGASVLYDEALMNSDEIFQSFLFDRSENLLVIEDADTLLGSREDDKNYLMSRFLNVSDGLIKLPNKKLVFTTNLDDFSKVDQALLRPGRCFGILHTRPLTFKEAVTAAKAAGVTQPTEQRDYTLAELFKGSKPGTARRIGFLPPG